MNTTPNAINSKIEMCVPIVFGFCGLPFRPLGLISEDTHPQTAECL